MNHHALTLLILDLNHLLDTGEYDTISIQDVYKHIDDGTILRFLHERAPGEFDLGDYVKGGPYGDFETFYLKHLHSLYDAYRGRESKWRVEKKGLCLLLAWTNEILQQGTGWRPDENISSRT